jgi:hypothetical protein
MPQTLRPRGIHHPSMSKLSQYPASRSSTINVWYFNITAGKFLQPLSLKTSAHLQLLRPVMNQFRGIRDTLFLSFFRYFSVSVSPDLLPRSSMIFRLFQWCYSVIGAWSTSAPRSDSDFERIGRLKWKPSNNYAEKFSFPCWTWLSGGWIRVTP